MGDPFTAATSWSILKLLLFEHLDKQLKHENLTTEAQRTQRKKELKTQSFRFLSVLCASVVKNLFDKSNNTFSSNHLPH